MQVKGQRNRVFRSGYRTRQNKNGEEKEGEKCFRLANTEVCQRCAKILRTGELLLPIY